MTLILTLMSADYIVQVSDRRFSYNIGPPDDEANKMVALICDNARALVGFSGLAQSGSYDTRRWLLATLGECGPPDFTIEGIIERLTARATDEYATNPNIRGLPPTTRTLTMVLAGFHDTGSDNIGFAATVSNCDNFTLHCAEPTFSFKGHRYPEHVRGGISHVLSVGIFPATPAERAPLEAMLLRGAKPKAVAEKAVWFVRKLANKKDAGNLIGRQLMSSIVRRTTPNITSYYHSNTFAMESRGPAIVYVTSDGGFRSSGLRIVGYREDGSQALLHVPPAKGNAPCPCNSGLKYKRCHGIKPKR
ncbi:SEC-C domain-containing protein [Sorangium sp. So ce854]|uniref:SEC-C domain-containing protein n=1 Tax=Sorangium sp. So ce854 TaxID=3133322 RepID=UPI003F62000B